MLMVGGPFNGRDEDFSHDTIRVPVAKPERAVPPPQPPFTGFRYVHYHRQKLVWFSRMLTIYACEGLSDDQLDDALMRLTLNETGLKLWSEGRPRPELPWRENT